MQEQRSGIYGAEADKAVKLFFISDIHGISSGLEKSLEYEKKFNADKIVILGDILGGGTGEKIVSLLEPLKSRIVAVKGNCDSGQTAAILGIPMPVSSTLMFGKTMLFMTHGDRWNEHFMPPVPAGSAIIRGHTHIPVCRKIAGTAIFCPGSVSLPRSGFPPSFGIFENGVFSVISADDESIILCGKL